MIDVRRLSAGRLTLALGRASGHKKRPMTRPVWLLFAFAAGACATLTPEGARVQVYQAPLDRSLPAHDMPRGCTLVSAKPQVSMTELDMQGQKHPFWAEQNEAASVGANVVLVRSRQVVSRHDPDCPGASPITDCPPGSGAWFDVLVERYACTQEALRTLGTLPGAQRSGGVGIVHRSGGR